MKITKESEQQPHSNASLGSHKIDDLQSNLVDQLNKLENGSTDKNAENSFVQKTKKKQLDGSAEVYFSQIVLNSWSNSIEVDHVHIQIAFSG